MTDTRSTSSGNSKPAKIGVLITNLGTPDAPEKGALRRYLKEFLSDPRVVEIPRPLWWLILHGVILNIRPARSAQSYQSIWTEAGSPLMVHTVAQAEALRDALAPVFGAQVVVDYAMRYGTPAISDRIQALCEQGVTQLLVLPLYPQYSGATGGSTFDAVAADFSRRRRVPELRFVADYHDHPSYIDALADSIRSYREQHGPADRLLFSYHGTPQSYYKQGDPYYDQCFATTALVAAALELDESQYLTTFQSRFGRAQWLQPYTDKTLQALPDQGIKSVQVVCPGFSVDCLETIEEIGIENRDYFVAAGGERYEYIPCLNSEPVHIAALAQIVQQQLAGWIEA